MRDERAGRMIEQGLIKQKSDDPVMMSTIKMQMGWDGGIYEINVMPSHRYVQTNWDFDRMEAFVYSSDAINGGKLATPIHAEKVSITKVEKSDTPVIVGE